LLYYLEQAAVEKTIIKQHLSAGLELPDRIQNAPQLELGNGLYWSAFFDLTTCRTTGWSVAPIPWTAMKEYSEVNEFDEYQTETLFFVVRAMDNAYMDWRAKKAE